MNGWSNKITFRWEITSIAILTFLLLNFFIPNQNALLIMKSMNIFILNIKQLQFIQQMIQTREDLFMVPIFFPFLSFIIYTVVGSVI